MTKKGRKKESGGEDGDTEGKQEKDGGRKEGRKEAMGGKIMIAYHDNPSFLLLVSIIDVIQQGTHGDHVQLCM